MSATDSLSTASFSLENRGPWTVMAVDEWPHFSLGQSTALGGGESPRLDSANRRRTFYGLFDVRGVYEAEQVHGDGLRTVGTHPSCSLETDGLHSSRSRNMLTMQTADCYPVFLKSSDDSHFALLHAGWRGIAGKIVPKALMEWFDGPVDVLLGAGISRDDYTVGESVLETFGDVLGLSVDEMDSLGLVEGRNLDLAAIIARQVAETSRQIESLKRIDRSTFSCTTPPLLSYRRDETDDRMVSWIYRYSR